MWNFTDKAVAKGFWAEANLSLTVSQLYYRGDIRPGINSLNSNFCAGIIWTNTDSQERSGVLTYTFIKQYAFPSLPGSFLACFWTFGHRLQQINYLLVAEAIYLFIRQYWKYLEREIFFTSLICLFACCCFFWYPGVFQDGRDLNAICASPRILHFVHGFVLAFFPCELRLLFI